VAETPRDGSPFNDQPDYEMFATRPPTATVLPPLEQSKRAALARTNNRLQQRMYRVWNMLGVTKLWDQ